MSTRPLLAGSGRKTRLFGEPLWLGHSRVASLISTGCCSLCGLVHLQACKPLCHSTGSGVCRQLDPHVTGGGWEGAC